MIHIKLTKLIPLLVLLRKVRGINSSAQGDLEWEMMERDVQGQIDREWHDWLWEARHPEEQFACSIKIEWKLF